MQFDASAAAIDQGTRGTVLQLALPVLAGSRYQELLADAGPDLEENGCRVFRGERRMAGLAIAPAGSDLEPAARELYDRLLSVTRGLSLYRIWNYIPQINALPAGLENYRRFCRGRSLAFETHFGNGFQRQLPAASAVGALAGPLALAFLAGDEPARHIENPQQIPAFEYPAYYGPRSPSFSRASLVIGESQRQLFISGTAAIRGHATIAPGNLPGQLTCTVENLRLISSTGGAGSDLGASQGWQRRFHVYVRHPADWPQVHAHLERGLLQPGDEVTGLQADLCRADLLVEIEAVLTAAG